MMNENMLFALYLMMVLGAVIVVLAICGTAVCVLSARTSSHDPGTALGNILDRLNILHILTVVVVIMSVFILTIIERLNADAAVSVLSGIVGYVLGGIARPQRAGTRGAEDPPISN